MSADFGDNVRIASSAETVALGLSGLNGIVHGFTTPSLTGVEVIGSTDQDFALNVHFEERGEGFWFAEHLVEFVDHAPGSEIAVGDVRLVRAEDGEWVSVCPPTVAAAPKPWWRIW